MTGDIINGMFEFVGSIFLILNLRRMYIDKCVKGVSILPVLFFTAWRFWNIYFYPSLGQWWSFAGGLCVCCVNTVWLIMFLIYASDIRFTEFENEDHRVRTSEEGGQGHGCPVRLYVPPCGTGDQESQEGRVC